MPVTDPVAPVFIAGYGPLPADFDNWIQAPFSFLTSKVLFRAEHHGGATLTASAFSLIPFDTILEDPYSGWNASTHVWTCPAGCSGWYEVTMTGAGSNSGNTTTSIEAAVDVNGTLYQEMSGDWDVDGHASLTSGSVPVALHGGLDTISGLIWTNTAATTPTTAGQYPAIEVCFISL